jgi:hypothetical protein
MNEEVGHDRTGLPLKIGDKVRVYGSTRMAFKGHESMYKRVNGREGIIARWSEKTQGAVEVHFLDFAPDERPPGGGVDRDWIVIPVLCEKVIEPVSLCAECDLPFPATIDYLCPGCRG